MTVEINLALIIACFSIFSTIVTAVWFFGKMKWDNVHLHDELHKQEIDINNLGTKVDALREEHQVEIKQVFNKIDALDKSVIEMYTSMKYVQETVREIKEGLRYYDKTRSE